MGPLCKGTPQRRPGTKPAVRTSTATVKHRRPERAPGSHSRRCLKGPPRHMPLACLAVVAGTSGQKDPFSFWGLTSQSVLCGAGPFKRSMRGRILRWKTSRSQTDAKGLWDRKCFGGRCRCPLPATKGPPRPRTFNLIRVSGRIRPGNCSTVRATKPGVFPALVALAFPMYEPECEKSTKGPEVGKSEAPWIAAVFAAAHRCPCPDGNGHDSSKPPTKPDSSNGNQTKITCQKFHSEIICRH